MTTSEPGPELDRRVAEAMGKGPVFVYDCYPCHEVFAAYSTDPARIAEMVEWLTARTDFDLRARYRGGLCHGVIFDGADDGYVTDALPIQHALALLVVAVADGSKHA